MHSFNTAPLLRLFIPFATAIVFKRFFLPELTVNPIWIVPLLLLGTRIERRRNATLRTGLFALISSSVVMLSGMCLFQQSRSICLPESFLRMHPESKYMITRVKQSGKGKLSGEAILITGVQLQPDACMKVYFSIAAGSKITPIPGDILLTEKKAEALASGASDRVFSFSKYLHEKHIFYTLKLKINGYGLARHAGQGAGSIIAAYQKRLGNSFDRLDTDTATMRMIKALVLGIDEGIDSETRNQFGITGTMHILSVSGLHVAAVFWMVNLLLAFPRHKRWGRVSKALLGVMALWIYSLLSGAEPPVLRSAFMFTFIQIGQSFRKTSHTFNLLILSAIILLVMDPETLFNLGFQLSFGAIAGILATQKALSESVGPFHNKAMKTIVELMLVSISAQWFTWPLCLHTFHTFPNYFLISNLVLVPQSSFLLYIGIVYVLFSPIAFAEPLLNTLLVKALYFFNLQLRFFSELPFAQSGPFAPDLVECLLLSLMMFFLAQYLGFRKPRSMYLAVAIVILNCTYSSYQQDKAQMRTELGLYMEKKKLHGWIIQGTQLLVWPERDTVFWNAAERKKNRISRVQYLTTTPKEISCAGIKIQFHQKPNIITSKTAQSHAMVSIVRNKATTGIAGSIKECKHEQTFGRSSGSKAFKGRTGAGKPSEHSMHHCLQDSGRLVIQLQP